MGIETAINGGSLALFSDGKEIDHFVGEKDVLCAESLLPVLDRLLKQNDVSRHQVKRVIVSTGPGSFTGMKIGIAAAMGLADGLGRPLVGMSALAALTMAVETEGNILTAVPVGRDFVCSQFFKKSSGNVTSISEAELFSVEQLSYSLATFSGTVVVDEELYQSLLSVDRIRMFSAGRNIASLLVRGFINGYCTDQVTPFFIDRKPIAATS